MSSHTSRSSRYTFLVSAAVCLLVGGRSGTAAAKDCMADSDCGAGYQCNLGLSGPTTQAPAGGATSIGSGPTSGSSSDGAGGAGGSVADPGAGAATGSSCPAGSICVSAPPSTKPPVSPVDAGVAPQPSDAAPPLPTPVVTGVCEPKPVLCTTVRDCPSADFDCVMNSLPIATPTCAAGTTCETPPAPPSTPGTCLAKVRACTTAADCPAPLTCQAGSSSCSSGGSVGPDGTVTTIPATCTPGPTVCTWIPATCATDSDCADPLYQCVKISESTSCAASASDCKPGVTCPAPLPPACATQVTTECLPRLVDCGAGQACRAGWSCFDFSNAGGIPPAWGIVASNQACLPDGIIFAAQGHATNGGQSAVTTGSRGTDSSGSGTVGLGAGTGTAVTSDAGSPAVPGVKSDNGPAPGGSASDAGTVVAPAGNTGTATGTAVTTAPSIGDTSPSPANAQPPAQGAPTASNADAGVSLEPMSHSSGCSYGGRDAGQADLWLALGVTGLVAQLTRRRRRDR